MKNCLYGPSAIALWRHFDNRVPGVRVFGHTVNAGPSLPDAFPSKNLESCCDLTDFGVDADLLEACDLRSFGLSRSSIHLLVDRSLRNKRVRGVKLHSTCESLPKGALLRVAPGVFCVSPEYLFVRYAMEADFLSAVLLGFELTGCYALRRDIPGGLLQRHPICSANSIERLLAKCKGMRGVEKAARALRYVVDGSGSPRETALVMLLCLPMRYGGFGLPFPQMNVRLDLGKGGGLFWGAANAFDLVWKDARLIVEYDGAETHAGDESRDRDNLRRDASIVAGYTVIGVSRRQLATVEGGYAVACAVAKKLGKQLRFRSCGFRERHLELRRRVLVQQGMMTDAA